MANINVEGYLKLNKNSSSATLLLKFWPSPAIVSPSKLPEYEIEVPLNESAYENLMRELNKRKEGEKMRTHDTLEFSLSLL